jgi:hypothetical protein
MILGLKKKQKPAEQTLRNFYEKRNKVLLIRDARGIGDILNVRMMFKSFKLHCPDIHLTFACFPQYAELVKDHPYLDAVISIADVNKNDYMVCYDISRCCIEYESKEMNRNVKHRAEIWADHCGLKIDDHDMYLPFISKEKILEGQERIKQLGAKTKTVFFSPFAYEKLRSLPLELVKDTIQMLKARNLTIYSAHNTELPELTSLGIPVLIGNTVPDWMSYIHAADYVVTVDTSNFHYAGAIGKPMVGIFTHVDGKLRGKFYDFVLVQKHRDNGDWPCGGPCYNYLYCSHPKCTAQIVGPNNQRTPLGLRPCVTELTAREIEAGIDKMLLRWPI